MTATTVGFIGLGFMGRPMALNIMKKGHRLVVHDVDRSAVDALVAKGAPAAASPREVAAAADIVITMLPDGPDVEKVALGPDGIAEGLRKDALHVDMSTIAPSITRRIGEAYAKRGLHLIDCPVGKTQDHAVAGTLTLLAGGDAAQVERARPVLMCMGDTLFHCGDLGAGETIKLVNNRLAATIIGAVSEALVTGTKAGLSLDLMREVMGTTMAANAHLSVNMPKKSLVGDFTPGFMVALAQKDVRLAQALAAELGVDSPVGAVTLELLGRAGAAGMAREDVGALLKLFEQQAGVEVRLPAAGAS
jgi:4-hydroxybutyrate dehydrogenase/sulfolactaldehyde 3-reductase